MSATATARRLVPLVAVAFALLTGPASAATISWSPCDEAFQCSQLQVPLDHSSPARGSVTLAVQRLAAASNPQKVAVVGLAGGPGQAALPLDSYFATVLKSGLANRDLLLFDQRGTGSSGLLSCDALTRARSLISGVLGCATELGSARGFYRTVDSVRDLEDLRIAGGYDKLVLYGVSYGTKVAQEYAATYPSNVESLILDSVVNTTGPDVFRRSSLQAVGRVLKSECSKNACRRATPDITADLKFVAGKLNGRTATAPVVSNRGKRVQYRLSQAGLLDLLIAGDQNPLLRAELPGSLRAVRRGDWAPLMRIAARSRSANTTAFAPGSGPDDTVAFLATTCEEANFPWNRSAGAVQRWTEVSAAAKRVPRASRTPFSARTMLETSSATLCVGWPTAGALPAPSTALAQVPTLILSGGADLRTPTEDAERVKVAVPHASLVQVPQTGHSVLSSDTGDCAIRAIEAFFAGSAISGCTSTRPYYSPTPRPAASFASLSPATGTSGNAGRAVRLIRDTVNDVISQTIGTALSTGALPVRVGGLRAGTASVTTRGGLLSLTLRRYQYVPGVNVSGQFSQTSGGTLTIRGDGIHARLEVSESGAVKGTVNGTQVRSVAAKASFATAGGSPTASELLERARLTTLIR